MSRSTKAIESLQTRLADEKTAHAVSINELQAEISRIWRLVPGYYINLMGIYPALRQLLHVLAEAADLQDPSRGAAYEDTMRTEYTPDGETLTQTERAVLTHQKHRADVRKMSVELDWFTHKLSKMLPGAEWEYTPPDGECEHCGRLLFQSDTGRPRRYCSVRCRVASSRSVTKRNETSTP